MTNPGVPTPSEENIPASVRGAMDLSQTVSAQTPSSESQASAPSEPSWRFDVESAEDFQKYVQLSSQGAVIFVMWADHSPASKDTLATLERIINTAGGNLLLAAVDTNKHPEIGQAFQIQGVPAAVAVINGQPAPMFNSQVTEEQMLQVLQQVLQVAAQQQLPGGFEPNVADEDEKPLPPLHQKAVDAIDAGDYEGARVAYQQALNENPGDKDAKIGLAQVGLLERVSGLNLADERQKAAADSTDVQAALNVADLDVTGGHVEDAFNRLISLFKVVDADTKNVVRQRLLDLFEVVGSADPRVTKDRADLMMDIF